MRGAIDSQVAGWYKARLFSASIPKVKIMSRVCQVTGKGPKTGNTGSKANGVS
jgi:hypothetical protein